MRASTEGFIGMLIWEHSFTIIPMNASRAYVCFSKSDFLDDLQSTLRGWIFLILIIPACYPNLFPHMTVNKANLVTSLIELFLRKQKCLQELFLSC